MARILVVDDDPDVVAMVTLGLKKAGHEVTSAHSRENGMKLVKSADPELVLLDIMMAEPDDGIAMAQDLRRQGFDKPILIMSSIDKVTGMSYGRDDEMVPVDDFVEKPVKSATLIKKIDALLASR
jgi:DNA-binding response OmpR family regulator